MILREEITKYLHYCAFQKELDWKTVKAYRQDLEQFVAFMEGHSGEIGKEEITAYLLYIHDGFKQKTVKRKIASVKAFFRYMEEEEIIEHDPFHKIKTKFKEEIVLPKIIPRNVIEMLLDYLYGEMVSENYTKKQKELLLRDIAVVEMLFATGIRISELCHLQSGYFDVHTGVLCIQGKGGKERYLQIGNSEVLELLKTYKNNFEEEIKQHGYFFVNRYGQPLSEQSARRMLHKHASAIETDRNITPHMFRHSFATFLMEEDVNIRYIQKMLGHSSITTTQIYTYVAMEKEREILRTRHPRNKMQVGKEMGYPS